MMNRPVVWILAFATLFSSGIAWAQAPKGKILLTDIIRTNNPETGAPQRSFEDLGTLKDITFNATQNWVLNLKLDSGVIRYIVFLNSYDDQGTQFTPSPARATVFKNAIAAETGSFQLLIDGAGESQFFAGTESAFGSGMYDQYLENPKMIFLSTLDIRIKDQTSGKVLTLDEYIDQHGGPIGDGPTPIEELYQWAKGKL